MLLLRKGSPACEDENTFSDEPCLERSHTGGTFPLPTAKWSSCEVSPDVFKARPDVAEEEEERLKELSEEMTGVEIVGAEDVARRERGFWRFCKVRRPKSRARIATTIALTPGATERRN